MSLLITATGPTSLRTFAFPDANATILTSNAAVTVAQGGTGLATLTAHALYAGNGTSAPTALAVGATGTMMIGATGADPLFSANPSATTLTLSTALALGTNPATTGALRMQSGASGAIVFRNNANSADLEAFVSTSSDQLRIGGNYAAIEFDGRVMFSGTSASFPALKRDTIFLQLRLADDSGVTGAVTASLPVGAAGRDGNIGFDTTLNALVYYVGGARFKLVGTSF